MQLPQIATAFAHSLAKSADFVHQFELSAAQFSDLKLRNHFGLVELGQHRFVGPKHQLSRSLMHALRQAEPHHSTAELTIDYLSAGLSLR
jgi:hypothetical protein